MTLIIAHRGLRNEAPENTLESIGQALALNGIDGVEFDVELTRDGQAVVLHQETMVAGEGFTRLESAVRDHISRDWVIEHDASEIVTLDAGSWFSAGFSHVGVPRLSQVLGLDWKGVTACVELKDATFWGRADRDRPEKMVNAVLAELLRFSGSMQIISFNPEILRLIHKRAGHIPATLALWTEWSGRIDEAIRRAHACSASVISLPDRMVLDSPQWIERAHRGGLGIHVYPLSPARGEPASRQWTAHSQTETAEKLVALGVDGLITDFARETLTSVQFRTRRGEL